MTKLLKVKLKGVKAQICIWKGAKGQSYKLKDAKVRSCIWKGAKVKPANSKAMDGTLNISYYYKVQSQKYSIN